MYTEICSWGLKERCYLEDPDINERIILRWFLKKRSVLIRLLWSTKSADLLHMSIRVL